MILYTFSDAIVQVENGVRRLWIGDSCQAQADNTKPYLPVSLYMKEILAKVKQPKSALLIGLGAGVIGSNLHRRGVEVEVIEPRIDIVDIAHRFFKFPKKIRVYFGLAEVMIDKTGKYDLIVIDAHDGVKHPEKVYCEEFYDKLREHLNPDGQILVNEIIDQKNVIKTLS